MKESSCLEREQQPNNRVPGRLMIMIARQWLFESASQSTSSPVSSLFLQLSLSLRGRLPRNPARCSATRSRRLIDPGPPHESSSPDPASPPPPPPLIR